MSTPWRGKHWIRDERRLAIHIRDEFACLYCGRSLKNAEPGELTLDHLRPRSAGGGNENENLVTACKPCNSSRGDRPWVDFAPGGALDRIEQRRRELVNIPLSKALLAGETGDPKLEALR
jgi:hypothetical protein